MRAATADPFQRRLDLVKLVHRFRSLNHIDIINQPRPEERALARVSKDGRRQGHATASFETPCFACLLRMRSVGLNYATDRRGGPPPEIKRRHAILAASP